MWSKVVCLAGGDEQRARCHVTMLGHLEDLWTISEAVNRIGTKSAKRRDQHVTLIVEGGGSHRSHAQHRTVGTFYIWTLVCEHLLELNWMERR
jgi:hypothetical protein